MKYDVNYFIKKFEAIPHNRWITGSGGWVGYNGAYCAGGHCGYDGTHMTDEAEALNDLLKKLQPKHNGRNFVTEDWAVIYTFNDGHETRYQQPTPKQRILAALYDIRDMQNKDKPKEEETKEKVKHVYHVVSIPCSITEQTKELIMQ